ncbi:MAG TPA: RNA polymerase sigma factor [Ktedonobacteraceae bacterium]
MDQGHENVSQLLASDVDGHFEQLMLLYQHRLYAFTLRQIGNAQNAEDIVQEAFLRAYHALKNYPPSRIQEMRLQQWLYKITLNVLRNATRTQQHTEVSLDLSENSPLPEIEDQASGPDELFNRQEWQQELVMLLMTLPPAYRLIINLHYFENLSYREIAALLNQPVGTVKAAVHRAIRLLRIALETGANEAR